MAVFAGSLESATLRPHPSARWVVSREHPALTIWQRNRPRSCEDASEVEWRGEAALIVRPHDAVQVHRVGAAACVLLDFCARGEPLLAALEAALSEDAASGVESLLGALIAAGAFSAIDPVAMGKQR
jgi:hypothetical protein